MAKPLVEVDSHVYAVKVDNSVPAGHIVLSDIQIRHGNFKLGEKAEVNALNMDFLSERASVTAATALSATFHAHF